MLFTHIRLDAVHMLNLLHAAVHMLSLLHAAISHAWCSFLAQAATSAKRPAEVAAMKVLSRQTEAMMVASMWALPSAPCCMLPGTNDVHCVAFTSGSSRDVRTCSSCLTYFLVVVTDVHSLEKAFVL